MTATALVAHNTEQLIEADDQIRAQQYISARYCPHQLRAGQAGLRMRNKSADFSSFSINHLEYGVDVSIAIGESTDCYFVIVPISGQLDMKHQQQTVFCNPEQAAVISASQVANLEMAGDCRTKVVKISRSAVDRQLGLLLGRPVSKPVLFDVSMDCLQGSSASWWRTVADLEKECSFDSSLFVTGPCLNQVEQMLISGLLYGQRHNYSEYLEARGSSIAPAHVRRAEKYIQNNLQAAIDIDEIVEASGVPRRTLYDGFKRFRGISPMNYLRSCRMDCAHGELQKADRNESITDIAMKWGFYHLGRFSIDYKKRYGTSPSKTLKAE